MRRFLALPLFLALSACSDGSTGSNDRPTIVVGVYPFQWLAEQVGGAGVDVTNVTKAGIEPHDVELTPRQVALVKQSRMVFKVKGLQPALDDLSPGDVSAKTGHPILTVDGVPDPHVWLDPLRMQGLVGEFISFANDVFYPPLTDLHSRAEALQKRLADLDKEIRGQLQNCRTREFVTNHAAFAYFADRYDLVQRGISGLSPDAEPTPAELAAAVRFAREHKVTTIFFESLVSPKVAETVAKEVRARTAVLDPLESVTGTDDYVSVMRRNAATLHDALGCR